MKKYPIHENLNTSFVNLYSLVSFLRNLQFVGSIHVELSSYEADITFTPVNLLIAREHDQIAGRISHGEDALRRILIRAKEPNGRIHVYPAAAKSGTDNPEAVYVDETIAAGARHTVSGPGDTPANYANGGRANFRPSMPIVINGMIFPEANPEMKLPEIPKASNKGKKNMFASADDWNELLTVTAELLRTIDESLEKANFHFSEALENACAIVSRDHPFIDPDSGGFIYKNGWISIPDQVAPEVFADGITEALKRIFERLREESRFSRVYRYTIIRIRLLIQRRKEQYDKFVITSRLENILVD